VAKQLGIKPVIKQLTIGEGGTADAARLALAIASNIGGKPLTREDRIRIAEYLYGQRNWTMEKIAEALNISTATIGRYLNGFSQSEKTSRPKGGRPKGKRQVKKRTGPTPDQRGPLRGPLEARAAAGQDGEAIRPPKRKCPGSGHFQGLPRRDRPQQEPRQRVRTQGWIERDAHHKPIGAHLMSIAQSVRFIPLE
jgi:Helix-turn-helix